MVEWEEEGREKRFLYLGDIELTTFGPYYGDAWSDLVDFERSLERIRPIEADWYGTFARLAGVDPTDHAAAASGLPPIDSVDVWPLVTGANATSPRDSSVEECVARKSDGVSEVASSSTTVSWPSSAAA